MNKAGKILIVTGPLRDLKEIRTSGKLSPGFRWIYCGKDVPFCIGLEQILGKEARIKIGDPLQECAKEFRQDYINYIGELCLLAKRQDVLDQWWLSSLSEKNPFISDAFLYFCYIKTCQRLAGTTDDEILIVCESSFLAQGLYMNLLDQTERIVRYVPGSFNVKLTNLGSSGKTLLRKMWFGFSYSSRRICARIFSLIARKSREKEPGIPEICIHSFTDERSLSDPMRYHHIYFRHFGQELEKKGKAFFYLIDLFPTASLVTCIYQLRIFSHQCYLLEEFVTIPEIIKTLVLVRNGKDISGPFLPLAGICMDSVIHGELYRDRAGTRREEALVRYFAGVRISMTHTLETFVYTFENHIWEKKFCNAFRSQTPDTKLVGYAHSIINPMYTCYSVSDKERALIPLPDLIAVNGKRAKDVLTQSGFTDDMIAVMGALRYSHLEKQKFIEKSAQKIIVLAALSASVNDSLELLNKALDALGNKDNILLLIKCHPTVPFSVLAKYLGKLPGNVCVREDSVDVLITESHVVLYSESAVCIESLAKGVPLINIRSDFRIDMNILDEIEAIPSVSGSEEIAEKIYEVMSREYIAQLQQIQYVVGEIFAPLRADFSDMLSGKNLISKSGKIKKRGGPVHPDFPDSR